MHGFTDTFMSRVASATDLGVLRAMGMLLVQAQVVKPKLTLRYENKKPRVTEMADRTMWKF